MSKPVLQFSNAFLWLVFADAAVGSLNGLIETLIGMSLLGWLHSITGMLVLTLAPVMFFVLAVFWRLPLSVFAPLLVYVWWAALGGMPFPLWVALATSGWLTAIVGLLVSGFSVWLVQRSYGDWLIPDSVLEEMPYRWGYTAGFSVAGIVLVPAITAFYSFHSLNLVIKSATAGFIYMDTEGLQIEQRDYVRDGDCADCKEYVHLIGMMHIGEADAYDNLFESYPIEDSVILSEGVTDKSGALGHGTNYGGVAASLGLEEQGAMGELTTIEDRNADIDVSQFSADTLRVLNMVLSVHASEDPATAITSFMGMEDDLLSDPDQLIETFRKDLIDLRNQNVLAETERVIGTEFDHVILPWGAIHMKGIEEGLHANGFETVGSSSRPFLRWSTLWAALKG